MHRTLLGIAAVFCLFVAGGALSGCGNDGRVEVRPAPEVTAVPSPTRVDQSQE
jgi:hypothetical protein